MRGADLAAEFWREAAGLDRRLWHTLRDLLFAPGRLSRCYTERTRSDYLSPVKVYLGAVLLAGLTTGGFSPDSPGVIAGIIAAPLRILPWQAIQDLATSYFGWFAVGIIVPLTGLVLSSVYPGRSYVFHLVFGLHVQAVIFVAMFAEGLTLWIWPSGRLPVFLVLAVAFAVHLAAAIREFYAAPVGRAVYGMIEFFSAYFAMLLLLAVSPTVISQWRDLFALSSYRAITLVVASALMCHFVGLGLTRLTRSWRTAPRAPTRLLVVTGMTVGLAVFTHSHELGMPQQVTFMYVNAVLIGWVIREAVMVHRWLAAARHGTPVH